jgi:myo-inositol-1(or 4)-monophosphatase
MSRELAAAVTACRTAGEFLRARFRRTTAYEKKGPIDFVTDADHESQRLISQALTQAFPHAVAGEEAAAQLPSRGSFWLVDPLDGTTNFLRGYPAFCVSIAFVSEAEATCGAVYDPLHDELFTAERGRGAFLNGERISTAATPSLAESVLSTGFPYDAWTCPEAPEAALGLFLRRVVTVRCDGAAALDLCNVAAGRVDGFWEERLQPWDMAAGALIVQEAGGRVSTREGMPFSLESASIVASNDRIHDALLEVLAVEGS